MSNEMDFTGIGIELADQAARDNIRKRKQAENFRDQVSIGVAYRQMMRIIKEIENGN